jgi:capsular polysaccharide transport system ATP-binding protein
VLDHLDLVVNPGDKLGILGRNGAGKSTLVRILSGAERPDTGSVTRSMSISWPLAFSGAFQGSLSGLDNLKFICRVYGVDYLTRIDYVQEFAELGKYFTEPVKSYSSGMQARLAFAISMAIDFDCFLIDEVISVGDARFHEKCEIELFQKRSDRALVIVSHEFHNIKEHCNQVGILENGRIQLMDDVDHAHAVYAASS